MPKVSNDYIMKSESHTQISVYVKKETLEALKTLIPNYKRGMLIDALLAEYVSRHGQDPVLDNSSKKRKGTKKK